MVVPLLFSLVKSVSNDVVIGVHVICALLCYLLFYKDFEGNSLFWLFFLISIVITVPASGYFIGFIRHNRCDECGHFSMKTGYGHRMRYTCSNCGYFYTESEQSYSSSSHSQSSSDSEEYLMDENGHRMDGHFGSNGDFYGKDGNTYKKNAGDDSWSRKE